MNTITSSNHIDSGLRIRLSFVREFTEPTIVGIRHSDGLSFVDEASAADLVRGINAKNKVGKLDYRVVEHTTAASL